MLYGFIEQIASETQGSGQFYHFLFDRKSTGRKGISRSWSEHKSHAIQLVEEVTFGRTKEHTDESLVG